MGVTSTRKYLLTGVVQPLLWVKDRCCLHHVFAKATGVVCVFCHRGSLPLDVLFCTAICHQGKLNFDVPFCTTICLLGSLKLVSCTLLQMLTHLLCRPQFSTAAVHAAEEQREAASKEAKRQELFPSLSSSSTPTNPAQSTGESLPISHESAWLLSANSAHL